MKLIRTIIQGCFIFFVMFSGVATGEVNDGGADSLSLSDLLNLDITTASITSQKESEAPSIVSVVTAKEIKNMGARKIIDVIRTIPGFDAVMGASQEPRHDLVVRGTKNSNKVNVMINGYSIKGNNSEVGVLFDRIPIGSVKQIEVIRGPGSALYGTGAFTGVINIKTEDGGDSPSELAISGGTYDTGTGEAKLSYNKNDFKLIAYANYYRTDGYDGIVEKDYAPFDNALLPFSGSAAPAKLNSEEEYYSLQTNIKYKNIFFQGLFNADDLSFPVTAYKTLTDESTAKYQYIFAEVGYDWDINEDLNMLIKTGYSYNNRELMLETFPEKTSELINYIVTTYGLSGGGFPAGESMYAGGNNNFSSLTAEVRTIYEIHPGIQLVAGSSYLNEKLFDIETSANANVSSNTLTINGVTYPPFGPTQLPEYFPTGINDISDQANWAEEVERDIFALYAQSSFDLKDLINLERGVNSLSFIAGFRFDHYSDVGSTFNPRAGIVYAPIEDLYFKLLYGRAFRAPSFEELHIRNNQAIAGNKDLNPETIDSIEAQIGWIITENIRSNITYFNLSANDLIQYADDPVTGGVQFANIGKTETNGVEAELRLAYDVQKYAYANITWQVVKNKTAGKELRQGYIAELYGNIGINYDVSEYIIANISANYVGEKERSEETTVVNGTEVKVDPRDPTDARTLLNASLTLKNFFKGFELQISGFNLLDDEYKDPDPEPDKLYYDYPRPGRTLMGTLRYVF